MACSGFWLWYFWSESSTNIHFLKHNVILKAKMSYKNPFVLHLSSSPAPKAPQVHLPCALKSTFFVVSTTHAKHTPHTQTQLTRKEERHALFCCRRPHLPPSPLRCTSLGPIYYTHRTHTTQNPYTHARRNAAPPVFVYRGSREAGAAPSKTGAALTTSTCDEGDWDSL